MNIEGNTWYWTCTMRTEDVLDGYISALDDFQDDDTVVFAAGDIADLLAKLREQREKLDDDNPDVDEMSYTSDLFDTAADAINQALPEGYYWGVDGNDPSYGGIMWHYECEKCLAGVEAKHEYVTF